MASDAVFPLHYVGRILPWVGLVEFSGQIELGVSVSAARPLGNLSVMASVARTRRNTLDTTGQASCR